MLTDVDRRLVAACLALGIRGVESVPFEGPTGASVAEGADLYTVGSLRQAARHKRSAVKAACADRGDQEGHGNNFLKHVEQMCRTIGSDRDAR